MEKSPTPVEIKLLQKSRVLEIKFDDGKHFALPCEYLRVFSPSAEVRGHGQSEGILVIGKQNVNIIGIDPIGNYAVKLIFDDGHSSGLYSWNTLYELGINQLQNWEHYLKRLENALPKPHYEEIAVPELSKVLANLPTKGTVELSPRDLVYLNIDDNYIHHVFPLIPDKQAVKPNYFETGEMGAHISIIYPEENKIIQQSELNKEHHFSIIGLFAATLNEKIYYILRVNALSLTKLRKRHYLNGHPYFKNYSVDLHITVAVRSIDIEKHA